MPQLHIDIPDEGTRSNLKRMVWLVIPHWRVLTLATVMLVVANMFGLALPVAIRWLVDTVFVTHNYKQLNWIVLGLLGLFVFQTGLSVGNGYLISRVGQRLIADLRLQIFSRVQSLPLRFFAERRTGEIVSRVSNDVTVLQQAVTETPINILRQVVTFVGGVVLMLIMNWQMTLFILVIIPPFIFFGMWFGRRFERLSTALQDRLADATVTLEEMLSGIRVVKSFARESFERNRYSKNVEATYATAIQRARLQAFFVPTISFLGFGALTLLLWYGGQQVISGVFTPGELVAFLFYMMMVSGPLAEFAGSYAQVRGALGAGKRVFELLDAIPEPLDTPGDIIPGRLRGQVRFIDVNFTYEQPQCILEDITLEVNPGDIIAIVGPSGVGKTTLVNLIPRFYDPISGRIEIDGTDTRLYNLRWLREQIGLVPQETFLFGGTLRENIAYGRPGADGSEILAAAQAANAQEFIDSFPDGYDTVVGEKGVKLSMGQRQRITIARMLLKNPQILILDEATSSLDSQSERLVQEALDRLMHGRTAFVIAHRLSTIQRADRIIVLKDGRIVEQGRHAELLERGGLYQHLWSLQFADIEP